MDRVSTCLAVCTVHTRTPLVQTTRLLRHFAVFYLWTNLEVNGSRWSFVALI